MAESRSALEILRAPDDWSPPPAAVIALVGDEPFLAGELLRLIRGHLVPDEADRSWAWREFDGEAIEDPRDIFDEAATSMGRRSRIRATSSMKRRRCRCLPERRGWRWCARPIRS
ncbi:MAG: hypothetical protein NT171_21745 [Planctomycetota bacterium]|nr:hypothetical protein [Planctomycetota bacterium]